MSLRSQDGGIRRREAVRQAKGTRVGQIEHVGRRTSPAVRPPGGVAQREPVAVAFAGQAVSYVPSRFTFEESWQLLSAGTREWAEQRAGAAVVDPHSSVPTVYWYCRVLPGRSDGPQAAAVPATYDLMMFGKRGLVVSGGTTQSFDSTGGTKWRNRRFDVPVDPSAVRHDHREAPADVSSAGATASGDQTTVGSSTPLLPTRVAEMLGNLPPATQRFLLEPFTVRGKRPVEAQVHPTTTEVGHLYRETYWCYLFDASWVSFAHAERSVPRTSGRTGADLWNDSPEAVALQQASWTVAAWVAPVQKHRSVVPV